LQPARAFRKLHYQPVQPGCGELAMTRYRLIVARLRGFWQEEDGPTATEYAILLAMIVLVAAATIQSIGERMYNIYENINTVMPE
jgi:pilus assembly protein Flp/PilA